MHGGDRSGISSMNNNEVSQNSWKNASARRLAQEYYDRLHNIGLYRQIHIKSLDKTLSLTQTSFKNTLDSVYQTLSQNALLPQIKISLQQTITDHDNLWWPIRLWRRFVTHRDIEDKRELFHYICAKEELDKFVKIDSQFTFKEVLVMPKSLLRKLVESIVPDKSENIKKSISSLLEQVESVSDSFTLKVNKIFSNDIEIELEVPGTSELENVYKTVIKQLNEFEFDNLSETEFQNKLDSIRQVYESKYQALATQHSGFEASCFSTFQEKINLIHDQIYLIRKKYDVYVEEKCDKDKLLVKAESENVVREINEQFYKGRFYHYQSLIDFYVEKKSAYMEQVIRPTQRFYKDGIYDETMTAHCIRQEQYIENEVEKFKKQYNLSQSNTGSHADNLIDNNSNTEKTVAHNSTSDDLSDLNKKYSEQKIELKMLFSSIKKSLLTANSESQLEQRKQASKNQIRQFYKEKMIFMFHPDKNPTLSDEAKEKFQFFSQKVDEVTNILDQITYVNFNMFKYQINKLQVDENVNESNNSMNFSNSHSSVTVDEIRELRRAFQREREEWSELSKVLSDIVKDYHKVREDYRNIREDYRNMREDYRKMREDYCKMREDLQNLSMHKESNPQDRKLEIKRKEEILREHMQTWNNLSDENDKSYNPIFNVSNENNKNISLNKCKSKSFPLPTSSAGLAPHASWFKTNCFSDSEITSQIVGDEQTRNNQPS